LNPNASVAIGLRATLVVQLKGPIVIGHLIVLALLSVPPAPVETEPVVSPSEFQSAFDASLAGKLSVSPDVRRSAESYRYVFVAGFMNEGKTEYFKQNAGELRAIGVPRTAIHFIFPSSKETLEGNAATVRAKFEEYAALGDEKLVVIAHSRGACDTLGFALQNSKFVSDHVKALFLVQGPFGGTAVADYVTGEGPPINGMPLAQRLIAQGLGRLEEHRMSRGVHGGLASLTRRASKEYWDRALEKHRDAIPVISPKTLYVTSRSNPGQLRLVLRTTGSYLGTHIGPNDGVVAVEDQSVAGVGTVLATLEAAHTDLTHQFPSAIPRRRLRRALIDAIIVGVGQSLETDD
jgi:hypothetical protein